MLGNPPFNRPRDELGRMSDSEIIGWFDHEREEGGVPVLKTAGSGHKPTPRAIFERLCFGYGITEREDLDRLWKIEEAKQAAKRAARRVLRNTRSAKKVIRGNRSEPTADANTAPKPGA